MGVPCMDVSGFESILTYNTRVTIFFERVTHPCMPASITDNDLASSQLEFKPSGKNVLTRCT